MTFGRNSAVGKKWLKALYGEDMDEAKVDKEYSEALQKLQSCSDDTIKSAVQQYMLYTYNDVLDAIDVLGQERNELFLL
jgi:predicted transcriptional regulator